MKAWEDLAKPRVPNHTNNRLFYGCKPHTTFATTRTLSFTIITPPRDTSTHTTTGKRRAGGVLQRLAAAARAVLDGHPGENKLLVVVCPQPKANTRHLDACPRRTPPHIQHPCEEH